MKILLIQLRAIGDVICNEPAVRALRKALPAATIDFLVEPASFPIVEKNPDINRVFVYDKKKHLSEIGRIRSERYDAVLDFMSNPRTTALTIFSGAKWRVTFAGGLRTRLYNVRIKGDRVPEYVPKRRARMVLGFLQKINVAIPDIPSLIPKLFLTDEDNQFAQVWLKKENLKGKDFAVITPVHKHPICRWRADGFKAVVEHLSKKGLIVYIMWGPGEEQTMKTLTSGYAHIIRQLPPNNLRSIAAILKQAKLFVANNSGAMHLAVSVGTPTVTIYGPTRAVDWNPTSADPSLRNQHAPLMAENVACLGCRLKKCTVGHLCMTELSNQTVISACDKLLAT